MLWGLWCCRELLKALFVWVGGGGSGLCVFSTLSFEGPEQLDQGFEVRDMAGLLIRNLL